MTLPATHTLADKEANDAEPQPQDEDFFTALSKFATDDAVEDAGKGSHPGSSGGATAAATNQAPQPAKEQLAAELPLPRVHPDPWSAATAPAYPVDAQSGQGGRGSWSSSIYAGAGVHGTDSSSSLDGDKNSAAAPAWRPAQPQPRATGSSVELPAAPLPGSGAGQVSSSQVSAPPGSTTSHAWQAHTAAEGSGINSSSNGLAGRPWGGGSSSSGGSLPNAAAAKDSGGAAPLTNGVGVGSSTGAYSGGGGSSNGMLSSSAASWWTSPAPGSAPATVPAGPSGGRFEQDTAHAAPRPSSLTPTSALAPPEQPRAPPLHTHARTRSDAQDSHAGEADLADLHLHSSAVGHATATALSPSDSLHSTPHLPKPSSSSVSLDQLDPKYSSLGAYKAQAQTDLGLWAGASRFGSSTTSDYLSSYSLGYGKGGGGGAPSFLESYLDNLLKPATAAVAPVAPAADPLEGGGGEPTVDLDGVEGEGVDEAAATAALGSAPAGQGMEDAGAGRGRAEAGLPPLAPHAGFTHHGRHPSTDSTSTSQAQVSGATRGMAEGRGA